MERTKSLLESSLASAVVTGTEKGMNAYIATQNGEKVDTAAYSNEIRQTDECHGLPPGCNCVCNQPCHGEGPCYSL